MSIDPISEWTRDIRGMTAPHLARSARSLPGTPSRRNSLSSRSHRGPLSRSVFRQLGVQSGRRDERRDWGSSCAFSIHHRHPGLQCPLSMSISAYAALGALVPSLPHTRVDVRMHVPCVRCFRCPYNSCSERSMRAVREFHHAGRARLRLSSLPRLVLVGRSTAPSERREHSPLITGGVLLRCAHSAPADLLALNVLALAAPTRQIHNTTRTALGPHPPLLTLDLLSVSRNSLISRAHSGRREAARHPTRPERTCAQRLEMLAHAPGLGCVFRPFLEPWVWTTTLAGRRDGLYW
ncbi:hypothetical protein AcV7_010400 [Taiwanofungus camphoratus]|nr:hypothetical protein AcV7_010400 [Antrodia cinnamomea]